MNRPAQHRRTAGLVSNVLSAGVAGLLLTACVSGREYVASPVPSVGSRLPSAPGVSPQTVPAAWWTAFGEPVLDELIRTALLENKDMAIAMGRVRLARASLREADAARLPELRGAAQTTAGDGGGSSQVAGSNRLEAGLLVGWELDLFGRLRHARDAAIGETQAAEADRVAVGTLVAVEVARAYLAWQGAEAQRTLARTAEANQRETLRLTHERLDAGFGLALDVAQAETQLAATSALIPPLERTRDEALNRLAVLTGAEPGSLVLRSPVTTAPGRVMALPVGDLDEALRLRPDIRAAEWRLAASSARVSQAVAEQFPQLSMTGFVGIITGGGAALGASSDAVWAAVPRLDVPLIDFGRARARIQGREAAAEIALATYEKTVLEAIAQVRDALSGYAREVEAERALLGQGRAARAAVALAEVRYQAGESDYLALLDTQRTLIATELALAAQAVRVNAAAVEIYGAIGRGAPSAAEPSNPEADP